MGEHQGKDENARAQNKGMPGPAQLEIPNPAYKKVGHS
jgi:hypothetical protein